MDRLLTRAAVLVFLILCRVCVAADAGAQQTITFNIDSQPLYSALLTFGQQANLDVLYEAGMQAKQLQASAVRGRYTVADALTILLGATGVTYTKVPPNLLVFHMPRPPTNLLSVAYWPEPLESASADMPEILVKGSTSTNTDSRRTAADMQNFVLITRDDIDRSAATNVVELIEQFVPGNTHPEALGTSGTIVGDAGQINLRGMGPNQTLILVNGRRVFGYAFGPLPLQPDINAIPLAAIDRIQVLPTSASALYGGDATAGVVNIVLRSDYEGMEVKVGYGASSAADPHARHASVIAGHVLERTGTRFLLAGSFDQETPLLTSDRRFLQEGRERILANNPEYFAYRASPPLGQLPNMASLDGSPLAPGKASYATVPRGYTSGLGAGPLLDNSGRYNLNLADSAQPDGGSRYVLRHGPQTMSLHGVVNQSFTDRFSAYTEFDLASERLSAPMSASSFLGLDGAVVGAGAPSNPFGQDIIVSVPSRAADGTLEQSLQTFWLAAGGKVTLPGSWSLLAEYGYTQSIARWSQPVGESALDAIYTGELDVLRDTGQSPLDLSPWLRTLSTSGLKSIGQSFTIQMAGQPFSLPAGAATVTAKFEHRNERFGHGVEYTDSGPGTEAVPVTLLSPQYRQIDSASTEWHLPVIPSDGDLGSSARVELTGATRGDWYHSNTGTPRVAADGSEPVLRSHSGFSAFSHMLGVRWAVTQDFALRASAASAFLPPSASELAPPLERTYGAGIFHDPRRGGEATGRLQVLAGGNPSLTPERARSASLGAILTPRFWPALEMSLDFTRIHKVDDIQTPALDFGNLAAFETLFPGRVTREPAAAGDPYGVGRITQIDATGINIAEEDVSALDAAFHYRPGWKSWGRVELLVRGTWQPRLRIRATPSASYENEVGITSDSPLPLSAIAALTFERGSWAATWSTQYLDSYIVSRNPVVVQNQGSLTVASQVYHDLTLKHEVRSWGSSWLKTDVEFAVRNVFDRAPPFDASAARGAYYSAFGDPRMRSYLMSLRVRF